MFRAGRGNDGLLRLTWNILDDLPIFHGRRHLERWYNMVPSLKQSWLLAVVQMGGVSWPETFEFGS
jgi:hypothetical protein